MGRRFDLATPTPLHLLLPNAWLAELKLHEPTVVWLLDCNGPKVCDISDRAQVSLILDELQSTITIDSVHKGVWSGSYHLVMKNGDRQEGKFSAIAKKERARSCGL
jgi:hypothetical protein